MKLVLSVEALTPSLSGIGRYTWELCQRLPHHEQLSQVKFQRAGMEIKKPARLLQADGNEHTVSAKVRLPRWARNWLQARANRECVFHGPNFFLPPQVERGVITVHDLSVFKYPETHPPERIKDFERNFSRSVRQAAHIITDSSTTRDEVMTFTGLSAKQVTAIPLGVAAVFSPRAPDVLHAPLGHYGLTCAGYGLCVSTVEPRKKIAELLAAWRLLPSAIRNQYPLVVIGGQGWRNEAIKSAIAQGEAEGWVKYLGFVPEADLPLFYAGARTFFYPSSYEGFGLPPVEAMASGVPVLVANRSCLPEITQGAAMLVDPDDVSSFALMIEQSLTDSTWRYQAVKTGLQVASSYSWQRCIDSTIKVYQKVMTG
ncbi:glycosyltransferase family 4 protein [Chromobacterium violaceum]|uniref:glycosyltransferase family 4 protein n=1 Tax=Chromobacterium violaceum TaxID=536 RepID=UPI001B321C68|nr:glycosyltransferase family 1 protein [Chromobacterium violaceum]MBP4044688.1 glycosyltransferase family 4 protein [Chromobacterium violaceum]